MAKIGTNHDWKYVGGRLCLDFVNTVGGRTGNRKYTILREKVEDYSALVEWSRLAGVLNLREAHRLGVQAAAHRREAGAMLARAIALREALYRIFKCSLEGRRPPPRDLETLAGEVRAAQARRRIVRSEAAFEWRWERSEDALDRVLWAVSLSAAEMLTSGDLARVRQCTGKDCGWLFLDTSRNRSRRWCDMQDCGNRDKVRRFRQRQQRARRARPA